MKVELTSQPDNAKVWVYQSSLELTDSDLKEMKKMKSYRGVRHMSRLPSRGQRTKSNFRRNKGKAIAGLKKKGVIRK